MRKNKQIAVIGLGRFGTAVTKTLIENGFDVMCCDKNMNLVKQMEGYVTKAIQADILEEGVIKSLGLNNFDVVIVAIGDNLESSVMAKMYEKEANKIVTPARLGHYKTIEDLIPYEIYALSCGYYLVDIYGSEFAIKTSLPFIEQLENTKRVKPLPSDYREKMAELATKYMEKNMKQRNLKNASKLWEKLFECFE